MSKTALIIGLLLEGLGILVIRESHRLGLQSITNPGAGLFPFLLGIVLCLLSLPICINSVKDLRNIHYKRMQEKSIQDQPNMKKLGVTAACLIGYFLLLDVLGFLITSFLFLFGLFSIGNRRWILTPVLSAIVVALAYLIFSILLEIPFPSGFWG